MAEKRLATDQVPLGGGGGGGGGAAALVSVEAEGVGGPHTNATTVYSLLPGTTVAFSLDEDKLVYFSGLADAFEPGVGANVQLGLRVDGLDYHGTVTFGAGNEQHTVVVNKSILLAAGPHTADLIFRQSDGGGSTARIISSAAKPSRLIALYTEPVFGVGALSKQEVVTSNAPTSTFNTSSTSFVPVPGTSMVLNFPAAQTVFFSAYGSCDRDGAFRVCTQIGIRIDGVDHAGSQDSSNGFGQAVQSGLFCSVAVSLAPGPHTAEIVIRRITTGTAGIFTDTNLPARLTAIFTAPEQLASPGSTLPTQVDAGDVASAGVAVEVSRVDHEHAVNTGADVDIMTTGDINLGGVSPKLARADHQHRLEVEVEDEGASIAFRPKLNFIGTGVTAVDDPGNDRVNVTVATASVTASPPTSIEPDDPSAVGIATDAARADHQHAIVTDVAGSIAIGDVAAEGVATSFSRSDHTHALSAPAAPVNVTKAAASAGVSSAPARSDHKHDISTAIVTDITDATNFEGIATTLTRSDHTHSHGSRGGGTLHAVATTSVAGFMSGADKTKLDGISSQTVDTFRFVGDGNIVTLTNLDGAWIAPRACTITRITLFRRTAGSSGSTTVDINKNGTTVFTTQANRPSIAFGAGNNVVNAHTDMDVTAVAQDDRIEVDVDVAEGGAAKDISVIIEVRYS